METTQYVPAVVSQADNSSNTFEADTATIYLNTVHRDAGANDKFEQLRSTDVAVSIVIPAYNEETIIRDVLTILLREIEAFPFKTEIVIVENGSTDITRQLLEIIVTHYANARLVSTDAPSYGKALKRGIELAAGDIVVIFNADLWSMRFFVEAVLLLERGYDVVVASKCLKTSLDCRPRIRKLITAAFNAFLRVAFRFTGTDTHGMKALRKSSVLPALRACVTEREVFDTELLLRLQRARASMCEIPTEVRDTRPARLSLTRRIPSTAIDLCRIWRELGIARHAAC